MERQRFQLWGRFWSSVFASKKQSDQEKGKKSSLWSRLLALIWKENREFELNLPGIGEAVETTEAQKVFATFQEQLTCTICLEVFVKAIALECGHNFCEDCLNNWRELNSNCPLCRRDINITITNFPLNDFIEQTYETATGDIKAKREALLHERANSFRAAVNAAARRVAASLSPTPLATLQTTHIAARAAVAPAPNTFRIPNGSVPIGTNVLHEPNRTVTVQDWPTTLRAGNGYGGTLGRRILQGQNVQGNQVAPIPPVPPVQSVPVVAHARRTAPAPAQNNRRILTTSISTGANAISGPNRIVTVHNWATSLRSGNGVTLGNRVRQTRIAPENPAQSNAGVYQNTRLANRRVTTTSRTTVTVNVGTLTINNPAQGGQAGQRVSTRLRQVARTSANIGTTAPGSIAGQH